MSGEGGTKKSRIIKAVVKLFTDKGVLHYLLITVTSGTAATKINKITIYLACNLLKNTS